MESNQLAKKAFLLVPLHFLLAAILGLSIRGETEHRHVL